MLPHKTTMSMSPPEDACRDGQFQVVPRAQALLDAVPLPPQPMGERGIPEALKFSMAHGESALSLRCVFVLWREMSLFNLCMLHLLVEKSR